MSPQQLLQVKVAAGNIHESDHAVMILRLDHSGTVQFFGLGSDQQYAFMLAVGAVLNNSQIAKSMNFTTPPPLLKPVD